MKRIILFGLFAALAAGLLFAGGAKEEGTQAKAPIKIGAPIPVTGWYAADGLNMKDGTTMAIEEINAAGGLLGRKLELDVFDIEDMVPEKVIAAADTLVMRDKVSVSVSGYAGVGADVEAFGKYPPVFLHGDGSIESVKLVRENPQYSHVFQLSGIERDWGTMLFNMLEKLPFKYPNKKLAALAVEFEWDQNVVKAAKERAKQKGWEIVVDETFPYGVREWTPYLTKLRDANPAIVIWSDADVSDAKSFVDQFIANPSNSVVDIGWVLGLPQYAEIATPSQDGVFGWSGVAPLPNAEGKAWEARFEKRFGRKPGNIAASTYDGVMLWANAVKAVKSADDHDAIARYIEKNPYKGIVGTYDYTQTNDHSTKADAQSLPVHEYQLQGGQPVEISLGLDKIPGTKVITPPWLKQ